jgi:hypothetical protein
LLTNGLLCHSTVQNLRFDCTNEYMTIYEEVDAV